MVLLLLPKYTGQAGLLSCFLEIWNVKVTDVFAKLPYEFRLQEMASFTVSQ